MKNKSANLVELTEYFLFLDNLRVGGSVNMFGSSVSLAKEYSLDRRFSSKVVGAWMKTFSDAPAHERAAAVQL